VRSADPVAAGLLLGAGLDALVGDPRRGHPVAGFGTLAGALERVAYRPHRAAGAVHVAALVGGVTLLGAASDRALARRPLARALVTAGGCWAVLGGRSLVREGRLVGAALGDGDVPTARTRLPHLCGRDPDALDEAGLARAAVESLAENTSDAVVAPLVWGAVAGLPGLLAYRAVNTLDAMVGHRSPRYARFGWAAARLDDVANLAPARFTGALACALAPLVGGDAVRAWRVLRRFGACHPSPNAGRCEAAFAGALGVTLGGRLAYGGRVEERPLLGQGPAPRAADVERAARLSRAVGTAALVSAAGVRVFLPGAVSGGRVLSGRPT
jgi:adenosylcobinamide-phosphate synthase